MAGATAVTPLVTRTSARYCNRMRTQITLKRMVKRLLLSFSHFARWGPFHIPHLTARSGRRYAAVPSGPRLRPLALLCLMLVMSGQPLLDACTTFCVRAGNQVLFGRNYDFEIGDGMVMVNPAGAQKKGYLAGGPSWRSNHGSVTFNQFGRGFPMGGMNQAGVVVELMWLEDTRYPVRDERAPLTVLEWIQYQLDTAGSVADILASDARVRIQGETPLHYLVSDKSGASATIEFLGGKLVAHKDSELPFSALANSTYASSKSFVEQRDRKSTRLNSSHGYQSRMPSSA